MHETVYDGAIIKGGSDRDKERLKDFVDDGIIIKERMKESKL